MAPYNEAPESGTRNGRPEAGRGPGAGALVGGALFVGLIALCALVISYNGIFQFAEYGGHEGSLLAHVFPVTYTLLLIMACWVSYMLRGAHPRERFWVDLVLIPILILFAAAAMLLSNLELVERVHQGIANVIVAVAPLAALLVAFLLWMALRAHMRGRRRAQNARPRPADDPTTVLRARSVAPTISSPETAGDEGSTLKARLLRLGPDDRDEESEEDREEDRRVDNAPDGRYGAPRDAEPVASDEEETRSGTREGSRDADGDPTGHEGEDGDGDPVGAEPLPAQRSTEPDLGEAEREGDEDEFASSVPTLPLPRRSRTGDNPIKRAVEQAPVVPGAAVPASAGTEPEPDPEPMVADHLADEGFDHQPPFGDPSSDEADAPSIATSAPEADPIADGEPAETPEVLEVPETPEVPEVPEDTEAPEEEDPEPLPSESTGNEPEDDPEPHAPATASDGTDIPSSAHWEPPEDDSGPHVLSDYVPPVWTPPEEDFPSLAQEPWEPENLPEHREPEPTPVLDHDTGPEVRAAFRFGDVPPGAARPSDEPVEPAPGLEEARDEGEADEEEAELLPEPDPPTSDADDPLPDAEELPPDDRARPDAERDDEPSSSDATGGRSRPDRSLSPVNKRPMVLKPPRPPMPDFAAGPPSRRVRSEPLRPDE